MILEATYFIQHIKYLSHENKRNALFRKNNQGNQGSSCNQKNVMQGQRADMKNRHTQQKHKVTKIIYT